MKLTDDRIERIRSWLDRRGMIDEEISALIDMALAHNAAKRQEEVRYFELMACRERYETAIKHLGHIHMLLHAEDTVADGKRWHFHPPESLVREAWEGLSKAIREIPIVIGDAPPDLAAKLKEARELIYRYRNETPLGHQPHMIARIADDFLARTK